MFYRALLLLLNGLLMLTLAGRALAEQQTLPPQYWGKIFSWTDKSLQHPTEGTMFEMLFEVTKQLPEYQHHYQAMSLTRGFTDLKSRDDLCMVGMRRSPERDQVGYFVGLWPVLPPQLVIRRADRHIIAGTQSSVSLAKLLGRNELRSAIIEGRYFGPELDPLIHAAKATGQIQSLQTSSQVNNLLRMLDMGRIDYTLDYVETFLSSSVDQPTLRDSLLLIPLEEVPTPSVTGIYCSRTPRGKQLIERIDKLTRDPQLQQRFKAHYTRFIPDEARQPYAQWLDTFFQQRSQYSLTNLPESAADL